MNKPSPENENWYDPDVLSVHKGEKKPKQSSPRLRFGGKVTPKKKKRKKRKKR